MFSIPGSRVFAGNNVCDGFPRISLAANRESDLWRPTGTKVEMGRTLAGSHPALSGRLQPQEGRQLVWSKITVVFVLLSHSRDTYRRMEDT